MELILSCAPPELGPRNLPQGSGFRDGSGGFWRFGLCASWPMGVQASTATCTPTTVPGILKHVFSTPFTRPLKGYLSLKNPQLNWVSACRLGRSIHQSVEGELGEVEGLGC